MAKREPKMPDKEKNTPLDTPSAIDLPTEPSPSVNDPLQVEGEVPKLTSEETAVSSQEDEAALREKEKLEPPAQSDLGRENISDHDPGDVVVSSDKIKEIISEKQAAKESSPEDPAPKQEKARGGKAKPEKAKKTDKPPKGEKTAKPKKAATEKETLKSEQPEQPLEPKEAPRSNEQEEIVYLNLSDLHPFKNHPFSVNDDAEMKALVASVKENGVISPAIVRPRQKGGYEVIAGHRRDMASKLAGFTNIPCVIRNLNDNQATMLMVEDNITQRDNIKPSEKAKALKMQLEAIKRQGARTPGQDVPKSEFGKRSNEIVAERNKMTAKQVQRYIKLNELVPDLIKMVDDKKIAFTPAVELAFIKPENQMYIAIAIESQQSTPSLSQAQRMRELDQKDQLNGDMIDGIMLEQKKEVEKVILSTQELGQYFGKDKTPRDMKDQIIKLLEEWKDQQKDLEKPKKQVEQEK